MCNSVWACVIAGTSFPPQDWNLLHFPEKSPMMDPGVKRVTSDNRSQSVSVSQSWKLLQWVRGTAAACWWGPVLQRQKLFVTTNFLGLLLCTRFAFPKLGLSAELASSSADMVCIKPKQRGPPALMCLARIQGKCTENILIIKNYGYESKAVSIAKFDHTLWKELCQNAFLRRNYVINYFYGMFQC